MFAFSFRSPHAVLAGDILERGGLVAEEVRKVAAHTTDAQLEAIRCADPADRVRRASPDATDPAELPTLPTLLALPACCAAPG